MQITYLDMVAAAEILESAKLLAEFEGPGMARTHVLNAAEGRDILLIVDGLTGDAMLIDECRHDIEVGGSVHHHARATSRLIDSIRDYDGSA